MPRTAFRFGPVVGRCWPYRRGEPAEPRVRAWLGAQPGLFAHGVELARDRYGRPQLYSTGSGIEDAAAGGADADPARGGPPPPTRARTTAPPADDGLAGGDVNWSHSGDWLIAAYAVGARVGVDLELLRPRPKALALAGRFFHPQETAELARWAADPPALQRRFTRLWCAKEAVLKAHGRGLSFGLEKLRFVFDPDAPADGDAVRAPRLVACDPRLGAPHDWALRAWTPVPGYLATVAWRASTPAYFRA